MKLSQFKFNLPDSLIAHTPANTRDESRLMVLHRDSGKIEHKIFKDVLDYFEDQDVMILNNTKVFPARMYGNKEKTGATIEVFLLRELNKELRLWDVLVDPARKIRVGNKLYFDEEFRRNVEILGETPLPKYIKRKATAEDKDRYQTIFAKHEGAVAAPTAGLHFSRELMKRLELKGVEFAEVTLHVGLGTFRPVEVEDLTKHKMDSEQFIIEEKQANIVNRAIERKKRICAVGTTSMRTIESAVSANKTLKPANDWTSKFIFPPYEFSIANSMITNFHTPESTLLMMISAFGGYEHVMNAYEVAVKEKYRFYSYGDAMLII
eukprot:gene17728-17943_t